MIICVLAICVIFYTNSDFISFAQADLHIQVCLEYCSPVFFIDPKSSSGNFIDIVASDLHTSLK
jgi:hypothetical protein